MRANEKLESKIMNEVTRYEVDMLHVGAADAVLLHFYVKRTLDAESEYVVLFDAGNEGDGDIILDHIKQYYNKKCIDLAICTHCDKDHFGGFKRLLEEHNNARSEFKINKFWIHDPGKHVTADDVKRFRLDDSARERIRHLLDFEDDSNLLAMIDEAGISREEVFAGKEDYSMNLRVWGPSLDYYEELLPDFRHDVDFYSREMKEEDRVRDDADDEVLSKALADASDDGSAQNQSSIVVSFEVGNKMLLFTGDAGKDALHRIVDADAYGRLKGVSFLKVPHHGSKHNLDNAIISYLKPKVSYVSTEKYGKYINKCTVNALKKLGKVYSTMKGVSIWHHPMDNNTREGYSTATPL